MADGRLTYTELFDAARAVGEWKAFDPSSIPADPYQAFATPTTPIAYAYEGYGLLDRASVTPLVRVLLGHTPQPARPEMQQWASFANTARATRWGTSPNPGP